MSEEFPFYIALLVAIVLLIIAADKIKVAYPVILVVAGLLISLIPGIPTMHIDPEIIFIIFLPPLLYEASWAISWKELWRWRRIIFSFAFLVVFITSVSVALAANAFIPGFTLPLGFVLGAIVSPPDAVSVGAILKFVKVPKRVASLLEGESLLNDASSLIVFQFALIAVGTGHFIWQEAAVSFVWMVVGGIITGLALGWIFMKVHEKLANDAKINTVLTLLTPFVIYIVAEEMHSSGVLAVVSGGLFLSYKRHKFIDASSRLRSINVWESLVFVLNGLVFMLIGLDLPEITAGLEGMSLFAAAGYGLFITVVLILVRIMCAYGAVVTTLVMRNFINVADKSNPDPGIPLIIGWSGMRGVVSLAAALSIPLTLKSGVEFPHRNLILFITFVVILTTLVLQGLTLPYVIRVIGFPKYDDYLPEEEASLKIRVALSEFSLKLISEQYSDELENSSMLQQLSSKWKNSNGENGAEFTHEDKAIYLDILQQQRNLLLDMNTIEDKIDEDILRTHLQKIDLIKLGS